MKQTRHLLIALALGTMLTSCGASVSTATVTGPAAYVDPYIGSGGHGHVFVGATGAFGAIKAGPQNIHKGWDWCSGYNHSDSIVIGFAHTHLSGTGCTDMGDVQIMPYTGELRSKRGRQEDIGGSCSSYYSHDNESVSPGYYSLKMDNGVRIEMTASTRTALHRITYPEAEGRRLLINLEEGNGDGAYDTYLRQTDAHTVEGYRFSKAMENPGFIGVEDIRSRYLPMGFSHFKIEGRGLGSALILEFLLYYMTKPEHQLKVREEIYLDNMLDLF